MDKHALNCSLPHSDEILPIFVKIDHTRDVVVARASTAQSPTVFTSPQVKDPPFLYGAYASTKHSWLISPVPASAQKLQLVWSGRTSKPFSIDEVAIFEGGVGCTPVKFEDGGEIHLFMYRRIPDAYQCEIHVVPSHVIFNCSKKYSISVHEKNGRTLEIKPQTFAKLSASSDGRFVVKVECQEVGVATSSIEVGRLGTRIAIVWEAESIPAGSVSIETSLGSVDSHMVTKVGKIQLGSRANDVFEKAERFGAVEDDIIWGRIELSQFTLSMSGSKMPTLGDSANLVRDSEDSHEKICTLELKKMKFEGSKVFQNDQHASNGSESQLRNSFSFTIGTIEIRDHTLGSKVPVVLQSSPTGQFFHATVKGRSSLYQTLVNLDRIDLRISEFDGKSEALILSISESFAWTLLHVIDQMKATASAASAIELELLEDDDDNVNFEVIIHRSKFYQPTKYSDPEYSTFFNIDLATVSPFVLIFTLETSPQELRKQRVQLSGPLAAPWVFFAENMKFKIDKANLSFSQFQASDIRGPLGKVISMLSTFYIGQLKYQVFTLMAAISLPEWEFHYTKEAISEVEKVLQLDFERTSGHKLIFGRDKRRQTAKAKAEAVVQELAHFIPGLNEEAVVIETPRPVRRQLASQAKKGIDLIRQWGFKGDKK